MLVYADENLEVIHRRGSSPYLLVTFNEMEMQANGSRFWGQRFCEKAGIAALGFISRRPNWFPAASVVAAVEAAAPILAEAPERILYGHSQGGYAALRYRRRFGASVAVAFCPQISIDPKTVPFDNRFVRHFAPGLHTNMAIAPDQAAGRAYLFYDPFHAVDRRHAERIAAIQNQTHLIPVHMTGHGTVRAFTGTARALSLIEACRADDRAGLRALARSARIGAPMRPYQIAIAAIARHPPGPTGVFDARRRLFTCGACKLSLPSGQPPHPRRRTRDRSRHARRGCGAPARAISALPGRLEELAGRIARSAPRHG